MPTRPSSYMARRDNSRGDFAELDRGRDVGLGNFSSSLDVCRLVRIAGIGRNSIAEDKLSRRLCVPRRAGHGNRDQRRKADTEIGRYGSRTPGVSALEIRGFRGQPSGAHTIRRTCPLR